MKIEKDVILQLCKGTDFICSVEGIEPTPQYEEA